MRKRKKRIILLIVLSVITFFVISIAIFAISDAIRFKKIDNILKDYNSESYIYYNENKVYYNNKEYPFIRLINHKIGDNIYILFLSNDYIIYGNGNTNHLFDSLNNYTEMFYYDGHLICTKKDSKDEYTYVNLNSYYEENGTILEIDYYKIRFSQKYYCTKAGDETELILEYDTLLTKRINLNYLIENNEALKRVHNVIRWINLYDAYVCNEKIIVVLYINYDYLIIVEYDFETNEIQVLNKLEEKMDLSYGFKVYYTGYNKCDVLESLISNL